MRVVHGICAVPGGDRLWAEDARRRGQPPPPAAGAPAPHPFTATAAELVPLTADGAASAGRLAVILPSTASGPLASPELMTALADAGSGPGDEQREVDGPVLRRWLVDTIRPGVPLAAVEPPDSVEVVQFGASALFLLAVDAFAADLADRGRVVPTVVAPAVVAPAVDVPTVDAPTVDAPTVDVPAVVAPTGGWGGGPPEARWAPVLAGPDAERFDELLATMPPAFRAVAAPAVAAPADAVDGDLPARTGPASAPSNVHEDADDADTDAGTDPLVALRVALDDLVDAHVRHRLQRAHPSPPTPGRRRSALASATAGWLRALAGDPGFTASAAAARELAAKVETWGAGGGWSSPMRVCFRLGEPGALQRTTPGNDDAWRVDFLLQSVEDPGVQLPAAQVWRRRPVEPASWTTDAEDALLEGLGRAVAVWPDLGRALHEARPTGLDLSLDEAQEFLGRAGALEQEGFGVLVPSWWVRPARATSRLTVRAVSPVTPILRDVTTDLGQIVDFRWAVSLGDVELSRAELDSLARAKRELVRLRGRWTRVSPDQLAALDLARQEAGRMTVRDVLALAGLWPASIGDDPAGADVEVAADGWLGALLAGPLPRPEPGATPAEPIEPPAGLGVRLRPYQVQGLAWLALLDRLGVGAVLADDMGLGKTIQVLALEVRTRANAAAALRPGPTLVVCPTSVLGNWRREAEQVAPGLRVHIHHTAHGRGDVTPAQAAAGHDLVLTTYTQLARDVDGFRLVGWDRLVLDEAQQIKNSATAQARAVRQLTARHRIALTGTPVENRLGDLWSIMHAVNPGLLGSAGSFRARYAVPIERYGDTGATARLRARIRPVVLRRVKTDPTVLRDLPRKMELRQLCTLTTEQASLYRAVVDDMLERLRDASSPVRRNGVVLAAMTRLKQVCNHPAHLLGDSSALPGRSGKLDRLEELLDQVVAAGERALCFTQFARFGAMLTPYLSSRLGVDVSFLHGGVRADERDALVERFQNGRGPGVFLLSLKAGGTGVNLTAANHVIHIDRWWNPAVEAQATDRAYRIGQRRDVWVRTLMCMGTLEERIDRILDDKAALARTVVGGGQTWLASLSTDELRDLVALAPEAVHD
jgi:hypothetical protein